MVDVKEIERIARLIKIEIDDHLVHIDRIKEMIEYFDILDNANIEGEDIRSQEIPITSLRDDQYVPYEMRLVDTLKNIKGVYIKTPRMT